MPININCGGVSGACLKRLLILLFPFLMNKDEAEGIIMRLKKLKRSLGGDGATLRAARAIIDFIDAK